MYQVVLVSAKDRVNFLIVPMRGCSLEPCRHPRAVVLYHSYIIVEGRSKGFAFLQRTGTWLWVEK